MSFERRDQISSPLHVVVPLFNSPRFRKRWTLFEDAVRRFEQSGAIVWTAEVAFGERDFVIQRDPARHLQWRTRDELWLKENTINLVVQRLPSDWKYVAWIDADVTFLRDDWANEALHQLQHFGAIQLWSQALDLDARHQVMQKFWSHFWCHRHRGQVPKLTRSSKSYYHGARQVPVSGIPVGYWHPGYAHAVRREVFEAAGGLWDLGVLGSADRLMADAMIGALEPLPRFIGENEALKLRRWAERVDEVLKRNVGYVEGAIAHQFHGHKIDRQYTNRWQILIDCGYDPDTDLVRDSQGLWRLRGNKPEMRDRFREYFRARNEDAC